MITLSHAFSPARVLAVSRGTSARAFASAPDFRARVARLIGEAKCTDTVVNKLSELCHGEAAFLDGLSRDLLEKALPPTVASSVWKSLQASHILSEAASPVASTTNRALLQPLRGGPITPKPLLKDLTRNRLGSPPQLRPPVPGLQRLSFGQLLTLLEKTPNEGKIVVNAAFTSDNSGRISYSPKGTISVDDAVFPDADATTNMHHPRSVAEVQAYVVLAAVKGVQLRVRGAGHSFPNNIITNQNPGDSQLVLMLNLIRDIEWANEDHTAVHVQGGCNIGVDPNDPTKTSTDANSLVEFLFNNGKALDDMGGISHQSVAGFMSTGSSGGSVKHELEILGLQLVDGLGNVHDLDRSHGDDFLAAGCAFGTCGIITRATLAVVDSFRVAGTESTTGYDDCPIDFFHDGNGKPTLADYLKSTEYCRILWWPQHATKSIVVWSANTIPMDDPRPKEPYIELGTDANPAVQLGVQLSGGVVLALLGNVNRPLSVAAPLQSLHQRALFLFDQIGIPGNFQEFIGAINQQVLDAFAAQMGSDFTDDLKKTLTKMLSYLMADTTRPSSVDQPIFPEFVGHWDPVEIAARHKSEFIGFNGPEIERLFDFLQQPVNYDAMLKVLNQFVTKRQTTFNGYCKDIVPMDNQMDDMLIPTRFTELWVPISRTADTIQVLRKFFEEDNRRCGTLDIEVYVARKSDFLLHQGSAVGDQAGEDLFRVDVFWCGLNSSKPPFMPTGVSPEAFYNQFWKLLKDNNIPFKCHLGKYRPPATAEWLEHSKQMYGSRWNRFLDARKKFDPRKTFLNDYWREQLGLSKKPDC